MQRLQYISLNKTNIGYRQTVNNEDFLIVIYYYKLLVSTLQNVADKHVQIDIQLHLIF
jgi:hypothetical protein